MIQVHTDINRLPDFKNAVITIGTFDGVHLGHQQIIRQLKTEAAAIGGETVIITFYPHPRQVVDQNKKDVKLLNTLKEKTELLNAQGVEHLVVVPFNETFANQAAHEYVQHFLAGRFHPHTVIIGYDHRFGKERKGDYHLLEDLAEKYNYRVKEIPEQIINEAIVSSTRIREALLKSDISTANNFLGYTYFFEGLVVTGNKLGRTIGYPTANLRVEEDEKLIPGNGIYAVEVLVKKNYYRGMMNIGIRPTINSTQRVIEVNVFDFDENIYDENVRVFVRQYIRKEQKFDGLEQLKNQLAKDKQEALKVLI